MAIRADASGGLDVSYRTGGRYVTTLPAATALRLSLAIVFILFGGIKVWPASPADDLVRYGVFFLPHEIFFPVLGLWEVAIGVALLHPRTVRLAVYLLIPQILGTQLPLVTLPSWTWVQFPVVPSDIGAYILKNWVLLSAGFVVFATVEDDRTALRSPSIPDHIRTFDRYLSSWIEQYGDIALRVSLAIVFLWFGVVTILGVDSESHLLADALSLPGPAGAIVVLYGALKVSIGLTLLSAPRIQWSAYLASVYMLITIVPLIVYPQQTFLVFPIAPSFEGVSILKDLILVSGVLVIATRLDNPE